ncbi:MAG: SDR family NAD(P)-dependent oxidoreductase [Balneolaceae bacterium]
MSTFYQNKTILITGAAKGVGRELAIQAAALGANLILWDRNPEQLRELKTTLSGEIQVIDTGVDVTDLETIRFEADQIIRAGYLPDIIITCAATVRGKTFLNHTTEDIDSTLRTNIGGTLHIVRAFLPKMVQRGSGHLVPIASAAGYLGPPKLSVYTAGKWALVGWAESLRLELKQSGVRVHLVVPGYIDSGMFNGVEPPRLVPILTTRTVAKRILKGIRKGRFKISMPYLVKLVPVLKALLPAWLFDWLAGPVLGVYTSMDTFRGRKPASPQSEGL